MRIISRKDILVLSRLLLLVLFSSAHPVIAADEPTKVGTDADIQQCIAEKLAASPALKDQGFVASVNNGVVTLTGVARNPGSKGNATRIAKKCGATTVNNNITLSPAFKATTKKGSSEQKP
jgi:phage tail sheath gpL-like